MLDNKIIYKKFCEEHPQIPIFSQYWWMEAVCAGKEWNVLFYKDKGGCIVAVLPFLLGLRFGSRFIVQPQLTQTNGVWIDYGSCKTEYDRLSLEKKVCEDFIMQLEKLNISFYSQCFHHSFKNWLPFYWNGFEQTTRYTYVIDDISDSEKVLNGFSPAKQRQVKKALRSGLTATWDIEPEAFYDFHCEALSGRGEENLVRKEVVLNLCNAAINRNQGRIVGIKDGDGNLHSALFFVWDKHAGYYLIPATVPRFKSSGASDYVVYETIKFLGDKTKSFDFEGSMSEGIENSYRQFGTRQVSYFKIEKCHSIIFKLWRMIKKS